MYKTVNQSTAAEKFAGEGCTGFSLEKYYVQHTNRCFSKSLMEKPQRKAAFI